MLWAAAEGMNITSQAQSIAGATGAPDRPRPRAFYVAAVVIVLAGLAAYHNSFSTPFVFDDEASITENRPSGTCWTSDGSLPRTR